MRIPLLLAVALIGGCSGGKAGSGAAEPAAAAAVALPAPASEPIILGESFTIDSKVMGEPRRVNVFVPTIYGEPITDPLPVLYMPDGGMNEDFLHVAGLVQVLVCNGGMRPHILVGIPNPVTPGNAARRRDLTGPTTNPEDRKIAPVVGESARFRRFIGEEVMPAVRARYRTTDEAAIVGESLAGLFVVETFFLEPRMFGTYIAIDPSLWWSNEALVIAAAGRVSQGVSAEGGMHGQTLWIATSSDSGLGPVVEKMAKAFEGKAGGELVCRHLPMIAETHATIYHPAAIRAFREVLGAKPKADAPK